MTKKELRHGYTTGACAAAAAKGAALMLRDQQIIDEVEITLPAGITTTFRLQGHRIAGEMASCHVIKDGGDDPDVTHGAEIHVAVKVDYFAPRRIVIEGGEGIGRITKPGLAVAVGEWAINPIPRLMILEVVKEVFAMRCIPHAITVTVSVPNGQELAKKTLNARLGIQGGISILGTTGIVRPLSSSAWTDTIDSAIDVALACGCDTIVLSTGRTSESIAQGYLSPKGCAEESFVMMGDHIGHAFQACMRKGVKKVVLAGQFAKLLKIACGHSQTHAAAADLDLGALSQWVDATPDAAHLSPLFRGANSARHLLESSGNDKTLIALVAERARRYVLGLAPKLSLKVLLAGYNGEVLYFG